MTERELTYNNQSRYDGYMELGGNTEVPQRSYEGRPISNQDDTRKLIANYERGSETSDDPSKDPRVQLTQEMDAWRDAEISPLQTKTREYIIKISKDVRKATSVGQVVAYADIIKNAASFAQKALVENLSSDKTSPAYKAAEERLKELDDAKTLWQRINNYRGLPPESRNEAVLSEREQIAQIALKVDNFFEREKIAPREADPYRQIRSFEELMTKWIDFQEDDRFRPEGEFALIDVEPMKPDEFGRSLLKETAHPDNFLRWIREKIEFYHDFDPMAGIDLFKNIYISAGFRTVNLYEMTVDFKTYFNHRDPGTAPLLVSHDNIQEAIKSEKFKGRLKKVQKQVAEGVEPEEPIEVWDGYYTDYIDYSEGNKEGKKKPAYVKYMGNDRQGNPIYSVYTKEMVKDKEVEMPVYAEVEDKDQWNTKFDPRYDRIRDKVMYEMWLGTFVHNFDVKYRLEGMPNEQKLKEVWAEIASQNLFTRGRDKLLSILSMPATSRKDEIEAFMDGEMDENKKQGSLGKGVQRCLAALYHLAEANGAANGYGGLDESNGEINPFKAVLRKKETRDTYEVRTDDIFYKSLIRQTLETPAYKHLIPAAMTDLVNTLNEGRKDWEKADVIDLLLLDQGSFMPILRSRGFTQEEFNTAVRKLEDLYTNGDKKDKEPKPNPERQKELQKWLRMSTLEKKRELFKEGNLSYSQRDPDQLGKFDYDEKDGYVGKFLRKDNLDGLDEFAVKFFASLYKASQKDTVDANVYVHIDYDPRAKEIVRKALRDVIQQTEKLDNFEAAYAEKWAFALSYFTGISARNDMNGIGHDAWSKLLNTEAYRQRQTGGGNYPGNLNNLTGIRRIGLDFWEAMKVQTADGKSGYNKMLYEILVGLEVKKDKDGKFVSARFNLDKDIEVFDFQGNAMRQFWADHMSHMIDFFGDVTSKHEIAELSKLVSEDGVGRLHINHEAMQKIMDNTWKHFRYGLDNRAFLYDNYMYGWRHDESIDEEGKVVRKPHFGMKTLRQLMFSEKVLSMEMYKRKDVSSWAKDEGKMARNVFAYVIAMQVLEHRRRNSGTGTYSAEGLALVAEAFMHFAARVVEGNNEIPVVLSGFFTPEEFYRIFLFGHALLWWMRAKESGEEGIAAFFTAFFEAASLIMKETGAGIKL